MSQFNRYARKKKNDDLLVEEDMDATLEKRDDSGKTFRFWFGVTVIAITVLLGVLKYDVEEGVDLPEHLLKTLRDAEEGEGVDGETRDAPPPETDKDMEAAYEALGVDDRLETTIRDSGKKERKKLTKIIVNEDGDEEEVVDEEAENKRSYQETAEYKRRLHNYEVRESIQNAWETHNDEYGALVTCGAKCESNHKNMEVAFLTLNSKVDKELWSVFDVDVLNGGGRVKAADLKKKMKKKIEEVNENTDEGSLERNMEVAELHDAYDILVDPKARRYYQMFGVKPPESMKYVDASHGGWGQDLLLRTHKNRLVLAWLDQIGSSWGDYTVLILIGAFGFVIPALVQLPRIIEMAKEIEAEEARMQKMQNKK